MPAPLIQILNGIIRNGTVQGVKIKVRPQNFERTLQILRTSVALKMVVWISIFVRRASY